ncbi:hypothetical protein QZH41_013621, partial [Actinostola sp. cb2023]
MLFTMYILKVVMLRDHSRHVSIPTFPFKSIHNHSFSQVISKSLQVHTSLHRKRFLDLTQYSLEVQQHWKSYAVELNKENRSLKKKNIILRNICTRNIALSNDYQKEVDAIQRTQHLQKVRALWNGVDEFYLEHKPQVVDAVLNDQANQHHLDATDVDIKRKIGDTYISGKLNVLSLVQLWNLSLKLLKDRIQQDSVPSFDESSPKIRNDIHTHHSLLSNAESLRFTLTKETIPDLKQSVEKLKTKIYQDMMELCGTASAPHQPSFHLGLGLIPATPPASFTAAETPASHRITSFQESLKRTPAGVSTPDVIDAWSESLRGRRPLAHMSHVSKISRSTKDGKITRNQKMDIPTQIPKPKNIQTGITRNHYKGGQLQFHKTLPKTGISASARKQASSKTRNDEIISPLALDQRPKVIRTEPKALCKEGDDVGRAYATTSVANQIIGVLSLDKPDSGSSSQSSRASTPKPQAVDDPLAALDETAFVSQDLLTRTPSLQKNYVRNGNQATDEYKRRQPLEESLSKSRQLSPDRNTLNGSGGLLEIILDQTKVPPSPKTLRTAVFSSPEQQDHGHEHGSSFSNYESPAPLLPPFAFETPKVYEDDDDSEVNLLTPFSFVTPLHVPGSITKGVQQGALPLTPRITHAKDKGYSTEPRGTRKVEKKLIHFTPVAPQVPGLGSAGETTKSDGLDNPLLMLSRTFEEQLSLSIEKHSTRTPGPETPVTASSKTIPGRSLGNNLSGHQNPKINLFEPTVVNECLGSTGSENQEPKTSPFGTLDVSDDEGRPQAPSDGIKPPVATPEYELSYKAMKESDLNLMVISKKSEGSPTRTTSKKNKTQKVSEICPVLFCTKDQVDTLVLPIGNVDLACTKVQEGSLEDCEKFHQVDTLVLPIGNVDLACTKVQEGSLEDCEKFRIPLQWQWHQICPVLFCTKDQVDTLVLPIGNVDLAC